MEKTFTKQLKIAIVGPESSGKSTLCEQLSKKLNCDWVPEFARTHLSKNPNYVKSDLDFMLQEQLKLERNSDSHILICDGDPISFKVWSMYKFGTTSDFIEEKVRSLTYDHYLLLRPDLPYEEDDLRENSPLKNRKELFQLFESELIRNNLSYSIIDGLNKNRLILSIKSLRKKKLI